MSATKQYAPKAVPQPKPYLLAHHRRDLYKSGLSDETIAREDFQSATDNRVWHLLHWSAGPGLLIPFDDTPEGFYRVKLDRPQKDGKQYRQPKDTVNRLYIPKSLDRARLADPTETIYITEGEKKTAKLVQEGFCAIACTGVFAWLHDNQPIPDLDGIPWEDHCVVIVFDSDPSEQSKGQVQNARRWLTAELTIRCAHVEAVDLPDDGKTKVGVDDYLVAHSVEEFLALPRFSVLRWSILSLLNKEGGGPSIPDK